MEREQLKVEEKICNRHLQGFRKVRRTQSSKGKKKSAMEKKVGLWIQILAVKRVSV